MIDVSKTDLTRVYDLANMLVDRYRKNLEEMKINASGQLSRTTDFEIEMDDKHLVVYFILESYALYIEQGRNRSTGKWGNWSSKYKDIENWLRQKIASGSFVPSGTHTIPRTEKEVKGVAGAIVHKITEKGFYGYDHHGLHPLKAVLDRAEAEGVLDMMIDSIVGEYEKEIDVEISKI